MNRNASTGIDRILEYSLKDFYQHNFLLLISMAYLNLTDKQIITVCDSFLLDSAYSSIISYSYCIAS